MTHVDNDLVPAEDSPDSGGCSATEGPPTAAGNERIEGSARCPISFTLDLLGDRWSLRLVRDMLLFGKRRYGEFLASCNGISTNILATRLKQLQADGLVERFSDPEDGKAAIYLPTKKCVALFPVLMELVRWGLEHDQHSIVNEEMTGEIRGEKKVLRLKIEQGIAQERAALSSSN
jgi:DNA-binding HxlR family transcriptional regulator